MTIRLHPVLIATFFAVMNGNEGSHNVLSLKNSYYQSFFIASALRSLGISSIAYRSAVRGITLLFFIT